MDSSYQIRETHYGDLSLTVHDRINDLHRRADGLARAVAASAMDSGCTDKTRREHSGMGPRQQNAWDMIAEAHDWNAISDDPETLNEAERLEREGTTYRLEYGSEGFQMILTEKPQRQAETANHACVLDDDGHTGHRDGAVTWTETEHVPTERVVTSQLRAGDVVREHGMRVRIDAVSKYTPDGGRCEVCHRDAHRPGMGNHSVHGHAYQPPVAWSCPGTVLNLPEVLADEVVPASFLMTRRWEDASGWVVDRRDAWTVQGNDLARWTVERPEPQRKAEATEPEPRTGKTLGEMTPAERAAVINRAAGRLQAELQANAGAIGRIMDEAGAPEPYTINGAPACGAPVDGGRCGRRPHHDGHPHIKEPGTEVTGEYYVMPHGDTAPASRPAARFPYTGLGAGDAFDQALSWAREYVKTSYDICHADAAGSTFIVQVLADGQLVWPLR